MTIKKYFQLSGNTLTGNPPLLFWGIVLGVFLIWPLFAGLQQDMDAWMMRRYITDRMSRPVHIVYFSDTDLEWLGEWPLARNIYGFLIDRLNQYQVKAVGVHVFWKENGIDDDENDLFLQHILERYPGTVAGYYFQQIDQHRDNEAGYSRYAWPDHVKPRRALPVSGMVLPDRNILKAPIHFGFVNLPLTAGGRVESSALLAKCGGKFYPSFAHQLARLYHPDCIDSLTASIQINFRTDPAHLSMIPVHRVIYPEDEKELAGQLMNSIVLIGVISSQLGLDRPVPVSASMPVVGIHAQIVDNLISGEYLRPITGWMFLVIFLIIGIAYWIISVSAEKWRRPVLAILMALYPAAYILLWKMHIVFPVFAAMAVNMIYGFFLILDENVFHRRRYQEEVRKRTHLETRFQEKVRMAARLEDEYSRLREKYFTDIEDIRDQLTSLNECDITAIQKEYPEIICARNSPMIRVLSEIHRIAKTDEPVMITGESGTGKELIARAIHQKSDRQKHQFVAINCGALTESILESELFGYEKGAFTGANRAKAGFFETAGQGTIFLDEITETSLAFQARLLRVLQEGTYYRVGSTRTSTINVRILAATNRDIEEVVRQNAFRNDLYFRLNVLPLHLPPLRDRREDIMLLLSHFLADKPLRWTQEAMEMLKLHHWPGNVRELQNLAARIRILDDHVLIGREWIEEQFPHSGKAPHPETEPGKRILQLYKELEFHNNANQLIGERLGHMHRSTVTDHLKGMMFRYFVEEKYQLNNVIRRINPDPNAAWDARVEKRLGKYLANLIRKVDSNKSWAENRKHLELQMKKFPRKYQEDALRIAESFLMGEWEM